MNLWPNFDLKFDPNLRGKKGKKKPENPQIQIWPKSRPKVINSPNKSHGDHIWGMFEL